MQGRNWALSAKSSLQPCAHPKEALFWASSQLGLVNWVQQRLTRAWVAEREALEKRARALCKGEIGRSLPKARSNPALTPKRRSFGPPANWALSSGCSSVYPELGLLRGRLLKKGRVHFRKGEIGRSLPQARSNPALTPKRCFFGPPANWALSIGCSSV